jgi:hypothetical protein
VAALRLTGSPLRIDEIPISSRWGPTIMADASGFAVA